MPLQLKNILKTIFKFNVDKYFQSELQDIDRNKSEDEIKREELEKLIGDEPFNYFNLAYETLKNIIYHNVDEIYNKNIKEQYCIVYCNYYLENLVKFIFTETTYSSTMKTKFLEFLSKDPTDLKETIRMVFLKLIKINYIRDNVEFLSNIKNWSSKYHLEQLVENYKPDTQKSVFNLFFSGNDKENYFQLVNNKLNIDTSKTQNFNCNKEQLFEILNIFFNQNISDLKKENNIKHLKMPSIKSFKNFTSELNQNTKNLINLFFDESTYSSKTKNIISDYSTDELEIILYGYKLSISCSLSDPKSIYSLMSSNNIIKELNKYYIPGAELYSDLHVESYYSINKYIQTSNKEGMGEGFYICNCGEWYYNTWCGVPISVTNCINCGKETGGKDEYLTKRGKEEYCKEIIRVYYDEKNKNAVENRSDLKKIYLDK